MAEWALSIRAAFGKVAIAPLPGNEKGRSLAAPPFPFVQREPSVD